MICGSVACWTARQGLNDEKRPVDTLGTHIPDPTVLTRENSRSLMMGEKIFGNNASLAMFRTGSAELTLS
jgi:hypothetical protein